MRHARLALFAGAATLICTAAATAGGDWASFVNETATRLVATPALGASDTQEKDYAWADFDQDGDIDLVVVRKQPFTSPGKQPGVLFMNEDGVLTDRTGQYASTAINVPVADLGLMQPCNNRDVVMADVDGDGWLDFITATTISDGDPKHIGHPRVYMNQGEVGGVWQGFVFDNDRIPQLMTPTLGIGFPPDPQPSTAQNPRFCSVAAGDLTGDDRPELYFGDYDSAGGGTGGTLEPQNIDMNSKLLVNDGSGFFSDGTAARLGGTITVSGGLGGTFAPWISAFGAAATIADINDDGNNDITWQTALTPPQFVGVAYNNDGTGFFHSTPGPSNYQVASPSSDVPYFVSVGDLDNNGLLDLIIAGDNTDVVKMNNGPAGAPVPSLSSKLLPSGTNGFGSQTLAADLDNDGRLDIMIADVDVDIPPCANRVADIIHNVSGTGSGITFTGGASSLASAAQGVGIPNNMLNGVHNFAAFDINGDCWTDLVIGRCTATQVWINAAPGGSACKTPACSGDLNDSGGIDGFDLALLLGAWGPCAGCPGDLDGSGSIDGFDLALLLGAWGPCK